MNASFWGLLRRPQNIFPQNLVRERFCTIFGKFRELSFVCFSVYTSKNLGKVQKI